MRLQETTVAALHPYDGYVAQCLGDGLLVYFGWPTAHEDVAAHAVYASLAIIEALQPLNNTRFAPQYAVRVQVRIGLHTGMAVIGRIGNANGLLAPPLRPHPSIIPRWRSCLAHGSCGAPNAPRLPRRSGPQHGGARGGATFAGAGQAAQDGRG